MNNGPKKKNRISKAKLQIDYTLQKLYDCAKWMERCISYERQREYMRRDIFMGKLNPEKFSRRLQDLNKYLDYIPIERTTLSDKTIKAYRKSLPEDEIRSIMGREIPPE
jgi:hypothetical protein